MAKLIAGVGELPTSAPVHDEQYDVDVYPAASTGAAVMDILVPVHGKLNLTMQCVKSLYDFTGSKFHLVILDDAPLSDCGLTEHWAREMQREKGNITYCLSRIPYKCGNTFFNVGLRYCRTEYVVTVMNSMTVEPAWEITALELMKSDPLIGSIGFKCLFPWGLIESAGIVFHGSTPTDFGRDWAGYRCNEVREAQAIQWAFALHRRKALEGNLDETIFEGHVGWDDIDNSFVLRSKGWKILYCGQGVGIHYPRATRGSDSVEAHLKNEKNAHTFYKRWGLWEAYMDSKRMDVGQVLSYETKARLTHTVQRIQVLQELLKAADVVIREQVNEALQELKVAPDQYMLEMNPLSNIWLLKVNPKATAVQATQAAPVQVAAPRPASDTEAPASVMETTVEEVKAA